MSHRIAIVTLFVALGSAVFSARSESCTEVLVENVRPQQGQLMVAVYGSAQTFGKEPLRQMRLPAGDARMSFKLCDLPGDQVALTLFQDLDNDGKMGRNLLGVPSEPWGASGTPGTFGPNWDSTRVALDGRAIVVKLSQ
jgi:uncharacterized protein (DUF2141 family)